MRASESEEEEEEAESETAEAAAIAVAPYLVRRLGATTGSESANEAGIAAGTTRTAAVVAVEYETRDADE